MTVKAYPQLGQRVGESVCVAGIDLDSPGWIRLNPCDFRALPPARQFEKYQEIFVEVRKARSDARPESFVPRLDTIQPIGRRLPGGRARERRAIVLPLLRDSMCAVIREQRERRTSLAVFRQEQPPAIVAHPQDTSWEPSKQLMANQERLIGAARSPLEKLPYRFNFRYRCADRSCRGHDQMNVDWELGQAFRNFRHLYGNDGALKKVREVWTSMWSPDRETFLYTGTKRGALESSCSSASSGPSASLQMTDQELRSKPSCLFSDDPTVTCLGILLETQDCDPVDAGEVDEEAHPMRRSVPQALPEGHLALGKPAALPHLPDLLRVAERSIELVDDALLPEALEQGEGREARLA